MALKRVGLSLVGGVAALAVAAAAQAEDVRGVTDDEIVFGSHTALSGPVAPWGEGSTNGIKMAFEEANADGGVHGRKLTLILEDTQYQVPKAVQATNKLINSDRIFAMVGALGTPMNNAAFQMQEQNNVPNLFPFTAARSMHTPFHKLKFAALSDYYDQTRAGVKYFVEEEGKEAVCTLYQDTDFGAEIKQGTVDQLDAMGMELTAEATHKPTDKDFVGQITKLKSAGCDLVTMGTIISDTIIPVLTAKKMGFDATFVGTVASYDAITAAKLSESGGDGYYAMTSFELVYPDTAEGKVKEWIESYQDKFGKNPNGAAQLGYNAGQIVVEGLENAGEDLTVESFIAGLEEIDSFESIFGGAPLEFGPDDHQGATESMLAVVENGRWTTLTGALAY